MRNDRRRELRSKAWLGRAVRLAAGRPRPRGVGHLLAIILLAGRAPSTSGLANAAFISTPASAAQSLWHLFRDGEIFLISARPCSRSHRSRLSVVFGNASAVVLDRNDWLNRIVSPFLTAFNSTPRIALGPLFVPWLGIGIASKVVLAFSLGYFIRLLSTPARKNVDRDLLLMSRLLRVSELRLFRHVRFPWALPGISAGLKLTLIYCSAGAVIGEMIAAKSVFSVPLQSFSGRFDVAGVLALTLIVALLAMT